MPVEVRAQDNPKDVLDAIPRVIKNQMYRDVLDIVVEKDGGQTWEYCTFTELRQELFKKPAGRWVAEMLKSDLFAVNMRAKLVNEMVGLLEEMEWIDRKSSIGLVLSKKGEEAREQIQTDMWEVTKDLYLRNGDGETEGSTGTE